MNKRYLLLFSLLLNILAFAILQSSSWVTMPLIIKVVATVFLLFFSPGLLLCHTFLMTAHWLERLLLSIGISIATTIITLYVTVMTVGQITPEIALIGLGSEICLLSIGVLFCYNKPINPMKICRGALLGFFITIIVALLLRVPNLGYSELQDDEIDVGNAAIRILRGDVDSILRDRRGPAQPVLTLAMMLLTDARQEWVLRLPPLLANVTAIALIWLLLYWIFDWRRATVAGIFLALDGFFLAYGRIVQMQSTMLLMMVLSLYLLYQSCHYREAKATYANYHLFAAAIVAGIGFWAHHEMIIFMPVLLWIWLDSIFHQKQSIPTSYMKLDKHSLQPSISGWHQLWANLRGPMPWITLFLFLMTIGSYYIPFLLHENFNETLRYYSGDIVGQTMASNLREYFLVGTFYNSTLYFVVIWGLVAFTLYSEINRRLNPLYRLRWLALILILVSICITGLSMIGEWNSSLFSFSIWMMLLLFILFGPKSSSASTPFFLWLFLFFLPYSYILQELHVHYYVYSIPAAILATLGLFRCGEELFQIISNYPALRRVGKIGGISCILIFCTLSGVYVWLNFVQAHPAYALTFPIHQSTLFPTPYTIRHGEAFGFPHKSGWKVISYLYQTGQLRGNYETNELYLKAHWYVRNTLDDAEPRYYFIATLPHRFQSAPSPQPFTDEYNHWGDVTVEGEVRLKIYEHARFGLPDEIQTFDAEKYEPLYDQGFSVSWLSIQENFQADDHFYRDIARFAEQHISEDTRSGLFFYVSKQQELLSYYYHGELPYITIQGNQLNEIEDRLSTLFADKNIQYERIYIMLWAENEYLSQTDIEEWFNRYSYKTGEQWFGNVRLLTYDIPNEPIRAENISYPLDLYLDSKISLLGYNLREPFRLTLFWRARSNIEQNYKIFVHLLNTKGEVIAQNDSEPVGGMRPTSTWNHLDADEIIVDNYGLHVPDDLKSESYTIAVGMYNPVTGQRLPLFDSSRIRLQNDMVLIPVGELKKDHTISK